MAGVQTGSAISKPGVDVEIRCRSTSGNVGLTFIKLVDLENFVPICLHSVVQLLPVWKSAILNFCSWPWSEMGGEVNRWNFVGITFHSGDIRVFSSRHFGFPGRTGIAAVCPFCSPFLVEKSLKHWC